MRKRKAIIIIEDIVRLYRNIKIAPGVSATHLDWTMVPYVRKSFWKHFKNGMKYIERANWDMMPNNDGRSIEDDIYKNWDKAYQYAMDMTEKEVHQAVEGMYHNLNTLGRLNRDIKNIAI